MCACVCLVAWMFGSEDERWVGLVEGFLKLRGRVGKGCFCGRNGVHCGGCRGE